MNEEDQEATTESGAGGSTTRRTVLKTAGALAVALGALDLAGRGRPAPVRLPLENAAAVLPDIQFDIGAFIAPVQTIAGVQFHFGPVYTSLVTATLTRNPSKIEQHTLSQAIDEIEAVYPFSASGVFVFLAYGLPYFSRLPGGVAGPLVSAHMPRLVSSTGRYALEEAMPGPTDVSAANPQIRKKTFNVPVRIEANDVLFTIRSDSLPTILDVHAWLLGNSGCLNGRPVPSPVLNGLFNVTSDRLNFVQPGLPRNLADQHRFSFAHQVNPTSPMWMGFADQQVHGSAPNGRTVTFLGTSTARLTTAKLGDYFDDGAVQHLSHVIDDLAQFYDTAATSAEPFSERVQYMFRSKKNDGTPGLPYPQDPNDPFTNGGGLGAPTGGTTAQQQSAFLENVFLGPNDITTNFDPAVTDHQKYRVGHLPGLQRSSRAADGTPLHIRMDGPGLSPMDVPDGSTQPTLEFTVFVPTAEFFRQMRVNAASLDYVKTGQQGGTATSVPPGDEAADSGDDGLETFLTATRRQNFLIPPRRHRSFPLLELT
jgi:hypothetical protein